MNTVRPDRAKILRRAIAPVISDFIMSSETAASDFQVVEDAMGIAIDRFRKLLMTAGLTAAVEETPSFHCPKCAQPLGAWKQKPRTIVTAQGEGSYPPVRYRCSECAEDHYPVEKANGIDGDQFTTGAKALIADFAADMPYAHVTKQLFSSRTVHVSPKEVDRTAREVANW